MMSTGVIIPAGGSGKRMGSRIEKQFLKLRGKSILEITLSRFQSHPEILEIVVVLPERRVEAAQALRKRFRKISAVVAGGKMRTQSVINGFRALSGKHKVVLIHDAVRPFIDKATITRTIRETRTHDATTVAVPVKDTIKIVHGTAILGSPNRKTLWHTQTPQGFRYPVLKQCLEFAALKKVYDTDECQLAEKLKKDVRVVMGSYLNFKITTPEDLLFAQGVLLQARS